MKRLLEKNPQLIGFLAVFTGVCLIGLVAVAAWGLLDVLSPVPTLAPTDASVSNKVTVAPSPSPIPENTPPTTASPSPAATQPSSTAATTRSEVTQHTVRAGDTLFDIALAYGVNVETLQAANQLEGETIVPGQVLTIPSGPLPTPIPYREGNSTVHTVSSGETLITIAQAYGVTVEAIQEANDLSSEFIQAGWELRIPTVSAAVETPSSIPPAEIVATPSWQPSILEGDLAAGYPLEIETERFTLHYQPDTPAARAPNQVAASVDGALDHIENKLQVSLEDRFDVYVAGSLFASPDLALRGRSFSAQRRNFYLYDDTGTPAERRYIITHELTHLVTWNTIGRPSSVMLHEGVAVYTGMEAMEAAGFVPLPHFCAAYQEAGLLPRLTGGRDYMGHIRDLDLYFAAGCFVDYLIENYGLDKFKELFASGNYRVIYGQSLGQLEAEWLESLEPLAEALAFDPDDLVKDVSQVAEGYDRLFTDFDGTPSQMGAYRELDQARIAVLQGRFVQAENHLDQFEALLAGE